MTKKLSFLLLLSCATVPILTLSMQDETSQNPAFYYCATNGEILDHYYNNDKLADVVETAGFFNEAPTSEHSVPDSHTEVAHERTSGAFKALIGNTASRIGSFMSRGVRCAASGIAAAGNATGHGLKVAGASVLNGIKKAPSRTALGAALC